MSEDSASRGQTRIFKHSLEKALSSENSKQLVDGHKLMTMQEKSHINHLVTCDEEAVDLSQKSKPQSSGNATQQAENEKCGGIEHNYSAYLASPFSKKDDTHFSNSEYTHYNLENSVIYERKIKRNPRATRSLSPETVNCDGNYRPRRRRQRSAELSEAIKLPDLLQGQTSFKDSFDSESCSNGVKIEWQASDKEVVEKNRERQNAVKISLCKPVRNVSDVSVCNKMKKLPEKLKTDTNEAVRVKQNNTKFKGYKWYPNTRRNSKDSNGCLKEISECSGVLKDTKKVFMHSNDSDQHVERSTFSKENKPFVKNWSTFNGRTDFNNYRNANRSRENKPFLKDRSTDYYNRRDYNRYSNSNWSREKTPYMKNSSTDYNSNFNFQTRHHAEVNRSTSSRHDFRFNKNSEKSTHFKKIDRSNNSQKVVTKYNRSMPLVQKQYNERQIDMTPYSEAKNRFVKRSSTEINTPKIQDEGSLDGSIWEEVQEKTLENSKECCIVSKSIVTDDGCNNTNSNVKFKHGEPDECSHRVNCLISNIFKSYKFEGLPNRANEIKTQSKELSIPNSLAASKRIVHKKDESSLQVASPNNTFCSCPEAENQKETLVQIQHDSKDPINHSAVEMQPPKDHCEGEMKISKSMKNETPSTYLVKDVHLKKKYFFEGETLLSACVDYERHPNLTTKLNTYSKEKTSNFNTVAQSKNTPDKSCSKSSSEFNSCSSEPNSDYEAELCSQSEWEERPTPKQVGSPDPRYYTQPYPYYPNYGLQNRDKQLHINDLRQGSAHPYYIFNAENKDRHAPILLRKLCLPASSFSTQESVEKINKFLKSCSIIIKELVQNGSDDHPSLNTYITVSIPDTSSDYNQGFNSLMNSQYSYEFYNSDKSVSASAPFNHSIPATMTNAHPPYFQHGFWPTHYVNHLDTAVRYPFGYFDPSSRMNNSSFMQAPFNNYEYPVPNLDMRDEGFNMWMYSHCAPLQAGHNGPHMFERNSVPQRGLVKSGNNKMTTDVETQNIILTDANVIKAESHIPKDMNQADQSEATRSDSCEGGKKKGMSKSLRDNSFDHNESGNSHVELNDSVNSQVDLNYSVNSQVDHNDSGNSHIELNDSVNSQVDLNDSVNSQVDLNDSGNSHIELNESVNPQIDLNDSVNSQIDLNDSVNSQIDLNDSVNSQVDLNDSGTEPLSPPVSVLTPKRIKKSKSKPLHRYAISSFLTPERLANDWTQRSSQPQDPLARNIYHGGDLTTVNASSYAQVSSKNTVKSWSGDKKFDGLIGKKCVQPVKTKSFSKTSVLSSLQNADSTHENAWYYEQFPSLATSKLSSIKDSDILNLREKAQPLNPGANWSDQCKLTNSFEQCKKRRRSAPLPNMSTVCSMSLKNRSDKNQNKQKACADDITLPSCCYSETSVLHKGKESCYEQKSPRAFSALDINYLFQDQLKSQYGYPTISQMPDFDEVTGDTAWATDFARKSKLYAHKFIDSHCHIDFLYKQLGLKDVPFKKFKEDHSVFFPANYEGCVAVFCNPRTFLADNPMDDTVKLLTGESDVWFAFGCHPKNATEFTEFHEIGLRRFLRHSQVVALGEIGLDYSGKFKQHAEVQKNVFRKQLVLALELNLPLVIHCRDADDDCLEILTEIVPRSHKIHAHCFTRDIHVAWRWLAPFPNLFLGLTPLITYSSALEAINTAHHIPLERLLLETDAPYFVPRTSIKMVTSCSYPGLALCTAEKVAEYKGIPVDAVLKACRENMQKMYGI